MTPNSAEACLLFGVRNLGFQVVNVSNFGESVMPVDFSRVEFFLDVLDEDLKKRRGNRNPQILNWNSKSTNLCETLKLILRNLQWHRNTGFSCQLCAEKHIKDVANTLTQRLIQLLTQR